MLQPETISTVENISMKLLEQTKLYKEAHDRDEMFQIKRDILSRIRELEKEIIELRKTVEVEVA